MDDYTGQITIIASSTMVHQRMRCMVCDQPVDHRVVFLTNDARVLHTGCVPEHVRVPNAVLLQAIRRLDHMVERARGDAGDEAPDLDERDGEAAPGELAAPEEPPDAPER
ncbi:MAG TPA: hypothetical protein VGM21_02790 [Actinomycetota bacterium]|jgi:hypothetical protein